MNLRIFSALTVMVAVSGCGSITRGTTENVTITSSPSDASISTSIGKYCPRSPYTIEVNRRTEFTAYAEKDGYKKGSIEIKTKVVGAGAAGFAGNVLIGGVIGMGVDAATGAALDHYPNPAHIELVPLGKRAPDKAAKPKRRKHTSTAKPSVSPRSSANTGPPLLTGGLVERPAIPLLAASSLPAIHPAFRADLRN